MGRLLHQSALITLMGLQNIGVVAATICEAAVDISHRFDDIVMSEGLMH